MQNCVNFNLSAPNQCFNLASLDYRRLTMFAVRIKLFYLLWQRQLLPAASISILLLRMVLVPYHSLTSKLSPTYFSHIIMKAMMISTITHQYLPTSSLKGFPIGISFCFSPRYDRSSLNAGLWYVNFITKLNLFLLRLKWGLFESSNAALPRGVNEFVWKCRKTEISSN